MKKTLITFFVIIIICLGVYFATKSSSKNPITETPTSTSTPVENATTSPSTGSGQSSEVIGTSVGQRAITAYHFGTGSDELLFIGGIHGGYSWNTSLVAYQFIDYLQQNPSIIPANIKVTVIPVLNPDGLDMVVGTTSEFTAAQVNTSQTVQVAGRYNADKVDLNRNFDCDWQSKGTWQNVTVSGGTSPFSEPESAALKAYTDAHTPTAVVAWYSSAGGVYASSCDNGVSATTDAITKAFAAASGYPAHENFSAYALTGDMTNWFAKNNVPAISVLLTNHTDTEWTKNLAGINAILKYFTK